MQSLFIWLAAAAALALLMGGCAYNANHNGNHGGADSRCYQLPDGFRVVEESSSGAFIRVASDTPADVEDIKFLHSALNGAFVNVYLCSSTAVARGEEYAAIFGSTLVLFDSGETYTLDCSR